LIRRAIFISYLIGFTTLFGQSDIVLKDDSHKSTLVQKNITGCIDDNIILKQKKQIRELKRELKRVLVKLSKMEKEINYTKKHKTQTKRKPKKRKRVKKHRNKTTTINRDYLKGEYIIVRVKRGDTLSKYAKKYYGDRSKYYRIYRANRDKIGRDLMLHIGDKIIIPLKDNSEKSYKNLKNIKKYNPNQEYYIPTYNTPLPTPKPTDNTENKLKMLDEVVYIDDNKNGQQDVIFIPLEEN